MPKPTIRAAITLPLLAGLAAFAVATSGCGGSSSAISVSPEAVAKAADTTSSAKTFHLTLNGTVGTTTVGTVSLTGNGAVDASKGLADLTLQVPNLPTGAGTSTGQFSIHELLINNILYIGFPNGLPGGAAIPNGKKWIEFDLKSALAKKGINIGQLGGGLGGVEPSQYLSYLRGAGQVKKLGTVTVNGVSTTHYHAVIDLQMALNRLRGSSPAAAAEIKNLVQQAGNPKIPVDVYIDAHGLVRREQVAFSIPSGPAAGTSVNITLDLSDFGVPVSVTPPPASEVQVLNTAGALSTPQTSTQQGSATNPAVKPHHGHRAGKQRGPSALY